MFIRSDQVEVLHALIRIDNDRRLEETVEPPRRIKNDAFLTRSVGRKSTGRFHCSTFSAVGSSTLPSGSSNPWVPCNEWRTSWRRRIFDAVFTAELADLTSARPLPPPVSFFFPLPMSHDSALTSASFHSGHKGAKRDFLLSTDLDRSKSRFVSKRTSRELTLQSDPSVNDPCHRLLLSKVQLYSSLRLRVHQKCLSLSLSLGIVRVV